MAWKKVAGSIGKPFELFQLRRRDEMRCLIEHRQKSTVGRHGGYEVERHTLLALSNLKLLS